MKKVVKLNHCNAEHEGNLSFMKWFGHFFFPNWHLHLKWLNNIKLIRHFYDLVCTIIVNIFKTVFCEKCLRPQVVLLCLLLCSSSVFYLNRKKIYSLKKYISDVSLLILWESTKNLVILFRNLRRGKIWEVPNLVGSFTK